MHNDHAESMPSNALGARVPPNQPAQAPARQPLSEDASSPATPGYVGHTRTADHLVPSTARELMIPSAGLIARNLDGALKRLDAERLAQVSDIGITEKDAADPRRILGQLAEATRRGELDEPTARQLWDCMFPGTDPSSVA
jgi:hypothetical protein